MIYVTTFENKNILRVSTFKIFRFVEKGLPNNTVCKQNDGGSEDVEMGQYFNNL